jgi:hypothetical protein
VLIIDGVCLVNTQILLSRHMWKLFDKEIPGKRHFYDFCISEYISLKLVVIKNVLFILPL